MFNNRTPTAFPDMCFRCGSSQTISQSVCSSKSILNLVQLTAFCWPAQSDSSHYTEISGKIDILETKSASDETQLSESLISRVLRTALVIRMTTGQLQTVRSVNYRVSRVDIVPPEVMPVTNARNG